MRTETCNGYINYPTWRVFNDILSNIEFTEKVVATQLNEIVEDVVLSNFIKHRGSHLVQDYATTFINSVDYEDIAEKINFDIK
jgi:hypothetical protein|tara:strand:- start:201 stop:449 length:249 start_codon:yes stop_codon:yes gene_type:complete